MKRLAVVGLAIGVWACSDLVGPDTVGLDRTYVLQDCSSGCTVYGSGSTQETIDSSRLVFVGDRTATWTSWFTNDVNSCYLSGGSCHVITHPSEIISGTYSISVDTVTLTVTTGSRQGSTFKFAGNIDRSVARGWAGPDSLSTLNPFGNNFSRRLVFR